MRARIAAVVLVVLALTGCSKATPAEDGGDPAPDGEGVLGTATAVPTEVTQPPAPVTTTATTATTPPALRCTALARAQVGSSSIPLADYGPGTVTLTDGAFDSPDGVRVRLGEPCAIGDLNGDGAADAMGVVQIESGGTGRFFTLVAWVNDGGSPRLAASTALGDRNGVGSITIADRVATVVYYTRTDDMPMAAVNIRRTATFELRSSGLVETGHRDEPCGPCW